MRIDISGNFSGENVDLHVDVPVQHIMEDVKLCSGRGYIPMDRYEKLEAKLKEREQEIKERNDEIDRCSRVLVQKRREVEKRDKIIVEQAKQIQEKDVRMQKMERDMRIT